MWNEAGGGGGGVGAKSKKEILFERTGFVIYSTFGSLLTHTGFQ